MRFVVAVAALLVTSAAVAEDPQKEPGSESPAAEAPAPAGLRAYVDPETGELTSAPSPRQVEALSKKLAKTLSRSSEGLKPFELALGGRGLYLRGRFQSAVVVRLDPEGGFELTCVDDSEHAEASLAAEDPPSEDGKVRWEEK